MNHSRLTPEFKFGSQTRKENDATREVLTQARIMYSGSKYRVASAPSPRTTPSSRRVYREAPRHFVYSSSGTLSRAPQSREWTSLLSLRTSSPRRASVINYGSLVVRQGSLDGSLNPSLRSSMGSYSGAGSVLANRFFPPNMNNSGLHGRARTQAASGAPGSAHTAKKTLTRACTAVLYCFRCQPTPSGPATAVDAEKF